MQVTIMDVASLMAHQEVTIEYFGSAMTPISETYDLNEAEDTYALISEYGKWVVKGIMADDNRIRILIGGPNE